MGSRYTDQTVRGLCPDRADSGVCTFRDPVNPSVATGKTIAGLQLNNSDL